MKNFSLAVIFQNFSMTSSIAPSKKFKQFSQRSLKKVFHLLKLFTTRRNIKIAKNHQILLYGVFETSTGPQSINFYALKYYRTFSGIESKFIGLDSMVIEKAFCVGFSRSIAFSNRHQAKKSWDTFDLRTFHFGNLLCHTE